MHYDDAPSYIQDCPSVKRRQERASRSSLAEKKSNHDEEKEIKSNHIEAKDVWKLNQIYIESQLDVIHGYLVHSKWKDRVNRYIHRNKNQQEHKYDEEEDEYELQDVDVVKVENKGKYITSSYGFGIQHRFVV